MRNDVRGELLKDENDKPIGFFPEYTQEVDNLRFHYRNLQAERAALQKEQTAKLEPKPGRAKRPRRESARELAKVIQEQAKIQEAKDLEEQKEQSAKSSRRKSANASESPTGNDRPPWRRGTARANEDIPPQISGAQAKFLGRRLPALPAGSFLGRRPLVPAGWLALDGLQPAVKF